MRIIKLLILTLFVVLYADYESGLLFDEKPMEFTWADCQGSVG